MITSKLKTLCAIIVVSVLSITSLSATTPLKTVRYNYLTYVPDNYDSLKNELVPVIIYLHGRSVSGTDIRRIRTYGLPYFLDKGKKLNYLVIAPQCPWGQNWASENWLDPIMEEVAAKYKIDPNRIFLTGMSLGGFGTWELANRYPNRFAAIAPICGGGRTDWAKNISHLPTWVFHGAQDRQVSVYRSDIMVEALKKKEAYVKYSRYPDKGHDLSRVYNDDSLYEWFSMFSRRPLGEGNRESLKPIEPIQVAGLKDTKPNAALLEFYESIQKTTF